MVLIVFKWQATLPIIIPIFFVFKKILIKRSTANVGK